MDLLTAIRVVDEFSENKSHVVSKLSRDDQIHEAIEACSVLVGRFKAMALPNVQETIYSLVPDMCFTFNTFYNETVDFIIDAKPRKHLIVNWFTILNMYLNDLKSMKHLKDSGSLGANIMNATFGKAGEIAHMGTALQTTKVSTNLLSYADQDILYMWLRRKDGFNDMIKSISLFLKVARP